jgi:hypothetical protein
MSLINEALKKAQTQRTGSALDAPPMPGGGSGGGRGGRGMPKGTLMLLIAGGITVVVVSVVATVYFVNRAPAPAPVAVNLPPITVPKAGTAVAASPAPSPSPVVIAPVVIPTPPPVVEVPTAPPPIVEMDHVAATTSPGPEPVEEGSLEDRIAAFVDKARVMGIRNSETGSKVLMNDKVYRLNDVVDRKLGLRLVKITPDSLTFVDANNATYVKNF